MKKVILGGIAAFLAFGLIGGMLFMPNGLMANVGIGDSVENKIIKGRVAEDGVNYSASVNWKVFRDGELIYDETDHNLLVDSGKNWIRTQIGSTSPEANGANWVALTNTAITPAAGDTCLSGEITANGLDRQQGTYATGATGVYTVQKTFTATGSQSAQASALFTADVTGTPCDSGDDGTMMAEATMTSASLVTNDQLQVTWTITVS